MEGGYKYAILPNRKILFGKREDIPTQQLTVVDLRPENFEADFQEWIRYKLPSKMEPNGIEEYGNDLINPIVKRIKENGEVFYFLDETGAGQAALAAWCCYTKVYEKHHEDTLELVCKAYRAIDNLPTKWSRIGAPRYTRMITFGKWFLQEITWKAFYNKISKQQAGMKKKARGLNHAGKVRSANLPNKFNDGPTCYVYAEGFLTLALTSGAQCEWRRMHPEILGPTLVNIVGMNGSQEEIKVHYLSNVWTGCSVYPEHLDENNELTAEFFEERNKILLDFYHVKSHPKAKKIAVAGELAKDSEPVCYYWGKNRMTKAQFRSFVWSELYAKAVIRTNEYENLKRMKNQGRSLMLIDYESFDFYEAGMAPHEAMLSDNNGWGIANILDCMLTGNIVWDHQYLMSL